MLKNILLITIFYNNNFFNLYKSNINKKKIFIFNNIKNNIPMSNILNYRNVILLDQFSYLNNNNKTIMNIYNDIYLNKLYVFINNKNIKSQSNIFFNSIWLERETKEFSNFNFEFLKDNRPLLLNYSDVNKILSKNKTVQDIDELKVSWLKKKIFFKNNKKVEL